MCGRFTLATTADQIHSTYGLSIPEPEPRFNIAPTQPVKALLDDAGALQMHDYLWGLIPSWSTDRRIASKCFNARSETVLTKPAFAVPMQKKRCVIPMSGFYEWTEKGKRAWFISADTGLLSTAGIWEAWQGPEGLLYTCSMLTRAANDQMAPYHDRMPLFLGSSQWNQWLEPGPITQGQLDYFNDEAPELAIHEVSLRVNDVSKDDPSLIDPIEPIQGTLGF